MSFAAMSALIVQVKNLTAFARRREKLVVRRRKRRRL
jgi:hypothetical protein